MKLFALCATISTGLAAKPMKMMMMMMASTAQ